MLMTGNKSSALQGKDCLTLADYTAADIYQLIDTAKQLKEQNYSSLLSGKSLAMIFEKSSTRTRVSFETAMTQLGGHALNLNTADMQIGRGETLADTAKVLSRYVDGIMIRTYAQQTLETWAEASDIPVINGLTDTFHPCQVLADLLTISEKLGDFAGKTLAFVGDGNNMAHSLLIGAAKVGMHCVVAAPAAHQPDPEIVQSAQEIAAKTGAHVQVTEDAKAAVADANIIYADVWKSMGDEDDEDGHQAFAPYQVNTSLLGAANKQPFFMHCLPAHRGLEVSADVMDGEASIVFDQAENRLHAQKALLASLL